jgi:hypothetical protein
MAKCSQCGTDSEGSESFARVASMSGSIMGDEHTESLFFCRDCQCYTILYCVDHFCGEETVRAEGPIAKEKGDRLAAIMAKCDLPWDKKCRCPAHREYFGDGLD